MSSGIEQKQEQLKQYWNTFVELGIISDEVRPMIAESWKRCKKMGFNTTCAMTVLPEAKLEKILEESRMLIDVAEPVLDRMRELVWKSQYVITLHDKSCCTIGCYFAGEKLVFPTTSFAIGGMMDEKHAGTNGASLCIAMNQEVHLTGAEHFHESFHQVNCFASPIRSEDGEVIGCINMVGHPAESSSHTLGLVSSLTYLIESQLNLRRTVKRVVNAFEVISEGLVSLDENYKTLRVSNYTACILGVAPEELCKLDFRSMFAFEDFEQRIEREKVAFSYAEYELKIGERIVPCNVTVAPVWIKDQTVGIVLILRECKAVTQLTNQVVGNRSYYSFDDIITEDKEVIAQINTMRDIARTDCSVLIEGESGAGKELFAHSIHTASKRAGGPFVVVNCASLPRSLVESELFGYEKGAFTGANNSGSPGKFELADGGTVFLDEIGELPLEIQAKLLRVLDNHRISRIGGKTEKPLDVRVIAATNRNLYQEVQEKSFRGDLYFRINVVKFDIPPLRSRGQDVCTLARFFLKEMNMKEQLEVKYFTEDFLHTIQTYIWPGNVRELHNAIVRAYYASKTASIDVCDLPADIQKCTVSEEVGKVEDSKNQIEVKTLDNYRQLEKYGMEEISKEQAFVGREEAKGIMTLQNPGSMAEFERGQIMDAIKSCDGDVVLAGASLGLSKSTVYRKVKKYTIDVKQCK